MRRIERRHITRDGTGRPIALRSERLIDDGLGNTRLVSEQRANRCSGCFRPIVDLAESRGVCDWCHARQCCAHCVAICQVCSRRLCGHCRLGFAGPPVATVCAVCHHWLTYRQAMQDQLAMQQTSFDRQMAQQRMLNEVEQLRLAADRLHFSNHFEAARLGLPAPPTLLRRVIGFGWRATVKMVDYATRSLRQNS
jgi:hypothetical protein